MEYGVIYAASFEAVAQAQLAESLGFSYIGFYDSPALETDVWITIANALQATRRIQIGTEVLIPHLRHPMAQATAIATIEHLAPGRLYVGVGTGFSGRMAMGQRPLTWAYMTEFIERLRGLLAGEDVVIDGGVCRMLHPPGFAAERPIRTPILVAANGPKGIEIARRLGDGLIFGDQPAKVPTGFNRLEVLVGGILLDEGETATSARVMESARPSFGLQYHLAYDGYLHGQEGVKALPYGEDWLALLEAYPPELRHLYVHDRHVVAMNALDAAFAERHPDAVADFAGMMACTVDAWRERIDAYAKAGATRMTCGTSFADWRGDMVRVAKAVGLTPPAG